MIVTAHLTSDRDSQRDQEKTEVGKEKTSSNRDILAASCSHANNGDVNLGPTSFFFPRKPAKRNI
jgi:hypothetical protein